MTWVKLTDDFTEHPKVLEAGPLAGWLWISAIAWANRNRTDGRLPCAILPRLATFDGIALQTGTFSADEVTAAMLAERLVVVGLFEPVDGGFLIHDYADYQPTVSVLAEQAEQKRRAGQAGGKASAQARGQRAAQADASPSAQPAGQAESNPVPGSRSSKSSNGSSPRASDPVDDDELPAEVWTLFAKRRSARATITGNRSRWLQTTADNARLELADDARRLWSTFVLTADELAQVLDAGPEHSQILRYATRKADA